MRAFVLAAGWMIVAAFIVMVCAALSHADYSVVSGYGATHTATPGGPPTPTSTPVPTATPTGPIPTPTPVPTPTGCMPPPIGCPPNSNPLG